MVDATIFMAAERNGHSGQIFEALRNRFPEIPEQVISRTLQTEVLLFCVISVSSFLWRICRYSQLLFVSGSRRSNSAYFVVFERLVVIFFPFLKVGCIVVEVLSRKIACKPSK